MQPFGVQIRSGSHTSPHDVPNSLSVVTHAPSWQITESSHGPGAGQVPWQAPPQPSAAPHALPAHSGEHATVTGKEHVACPPLGSVAVQVTAVVPWANAKPVGGSQTRVTGSQLSTAVTT